MQFARSPKENEDKKGTSHLGHPFKEIQAHWTAKPAQEAIILFSGPNHGHYVSLVKSHNHWLLVDDENVEMLDESAVHAFFGSAQKYSNNTVHGYILFYERVLSVIGGGNGSVYGLVVDWPNLNLWNLDQKTEAGPNVLRCWKAACVELDLGRVEMTSPGGLVGLSEDLMQIGPHEECLDVQADMERRDEPTTNGSHPNVWQTTQLRESWERKESPPGFYSGEGEEDDQIRSNDAMEDPHNQSEQDLEDESPWPVVIFQKDEIREMAAPYQRALAVKVLGRTLSDSVQYYPNHITEPPDQNIPSDFLSELGNQSALHPIDNPPPPPPAYYNGDTTLEEDNDSNSSMDDEEGSWKRIDGDISVALRPRDFVAGDN
ncbi:hypothetical protein BUALT_Bualt11G0017900 [Buddleja alternifolia]|uniref:USP domain-containing protein n=1 Tax=Buddleja alternifolia TaxID=168488 RepID=A0AAV6WY52_9LAMI|nr:hypothetical protein BUALT_Bualt11G0017900 [Buddleja alternifolia]